MTTIQDRIKYTILLFIVSFVLLYLILDLGITEPYSISVIASISISFFWASIFASLYFILSLEQDYKKISKNFPNGLQDWKRAKRIIKTIFDIDNTSANSIKNTINAVESINDIVERENSIYEKLKCLRLKYPYGVNYVINKYPNYITVQILELEKEIISSQKEHDHQEKIKRLKNDYHVIEVTYPLGLDEWKRKNKIIDPLSELELEQAVSEESKIAQYHNRLKKIESDQKDLEFWVEKQEKFAWYCRELRNDFLKDFGCYTYNIDFSVNKFKTSKETKVWQFFPYSFCLYLGLDYTHFQLDKKNAERIVQGRYYISKEHAKIIAEYIIKLNSDEITALYFCPPFNEKDLRKYDSIYSSIEDELNNSINEKYIYNPVADTLWGIEPKIADWVEHIKSRVVIIDVATDNNRLKDVCKDIVNVAAKKFPLITFISIMKGFDKDEMVELIDKKNEEIAKKEEEERKRKEAEVLAKKNLIQGTSSWDPTSGGLRYNYLFYYYPTTCDFEANEEEWSNRWIVWDFKNTPGKTSASDHQAALDKVIPMIKDKLLSTFNEKSLKYLTLVCIPASSKEKTQARYEEFSNRICGELGLINAYPHISVIAEKEERRSGGTTIDTNKLSFDEEFFKGKYVLLFDDVITRGDSMRIFKRKMESLGAIVVGGLALGKTKHERP